MQGVILLGRPPDLLAPGLMEKPVHESVFGSFGMRRMILRGRPPDLAGGDRTVGSGSACSRECPWMLQDAKDNPTRSSARPPPGYWPYGGTGSLVELELVIQTAQVRPCPGVAEGLGEVSEVSRNWVVWF